MVSFSQLPVVNKKDTIFGAARKIFGPSYSISNVKRFLLLFPRLWYDFLNSYRSFLVLSFRFSLWIINCFKKLSIDGAAVAWTIAVNNFYPSYFSWPSQCINFLINLAVFNFFSYCILFLQIKLWSFNYTQSFFNNTVKWLFYEINVYEWVFSCSNYFHKLGPYNHMKALEKIYFKRVIKNRKK